MPDFATTKPQCFFGAICGNRADYFAHTTLDKALVGKDAAFEIDLANHISDIFLMYV